MMKTLKKSDMGRVLWRMTHGCLGHIKLWWNNDVMLLYIDVASELAFTPALTPTPAHLQIIPSDILSGVGCPLVAFSPNRLIKFDWVSIRFDYRMSWLVTSCDFNSYRDSAWKLEEYLYTQNVTLHRTLMLKVIAHSQHASTLNKRIWF